MSFLIAAAGTGGHVFPGLAVAEALIELEVDRGGIVFVGGDRLEATVYPDHGFEFIELELRGLKRSLSLSNLSLPAVVFRARNRIADEIRERKVGAVLGMGGYVTIPAALAARRTRIPLMLAEQNAGAGLANRIAARWSARTFISFPETGGLAKGEWVGNPVRRQISTFDRSSLRMEAMQHYRLDQEVPVVGVFGGSLGAAVINEAISEMLGSWTGDPIQVIHLVGSTHEAKFDDVSVGEGVRWLRIGFEDRMDLFFAAIDLVVSRAGGAVAEITATATPSILIPGDFGSSGHQSSNAAYLLDEGAAIVLEEENLYTLADTVADCMADRVRLDEMASAARRIAKPDAAKAIARAMIDSSR